MPSKALLVIDMQKDLCYDLRRKHKVDKIINPLKQTIDLFAASGYPIFYICLSLPADDAQFKRFGDKYCIEGTDGTEVISELQPLQGMIITKRKHSAFFETDLENQLKEGNIEEIYLSGLQTQICIMTTAADASFRGYRAVALSDCVLSTQEKNKQDALEWIARYVGEVMSLRELQQEWHSD